MIRNETFDNGVCIYAEIIDLDANTYTAEQDGRIVESPRSLTIEERCQYGPQPLDYAGATATLNVVLGIWPIEDAANLVNLTPADLIAEAEAWAAAMEMNS